MALVIGLLTAGAYRSADFFGGFATRRNPLSAVVFTIMAVGLVVAPFLVIAFPEPFPPVHVVALSAGIGIVGAEPTSGGSRTRELAVAVGAGVGFGVVFIVFAETGDNAGFWPVLLSRCFSVPVVLGLALATGRTLRLPRAALKPAGAPRTHGAERAHEAHADRGSGRGAHRTRAHRGRLML